MKLEEVLPLMREGKTARMESETDGSYWICGSQGNVSLGLPMIKTIVKIQKDGKHLADSLSWGIPRWAIMAEDWVIYE